MTDHPSALVSVPVEPTEAMIEAGFEAMARAEADGVDQAPSEVWSAMLAAATAAPEAAATDGLLPCPFCGEAVRIRKGLNGYGHCPTEGCHAHRAQTVSLDDEKQVAAWNRRAPSREPEGGAVTEHLTLARRYLEGRKIASALILIDKALSALATREEAPAEAGEPKYFAAFMAEDGALRAQPQAREDAQPVIAAGRTLADALRQYGFPVSGGAKAALTDHGSAEAFALNEAAVAFLAALQAEQGAK